LEVEVGSILEERLLVSSEGRVLSWNFGSVYRVQEWGQGTTLRDRRSNGYVGGVFSSLLLPEKLILKVGLED
jgi:hypothetical protein